MSEQLTDIQRRALLRGEVQKLQAIGMDYDTAHRTAFEGHPEWRVVEPLGGQTRQRRTGAQIVNDGAALTDTERSRRIQELVVAYMSANKVAYDVAFQRILSDSKNKELVQGMHQPERAFKSAQTNYGAGRNTPARTPAPKKADGKFSLGIPPNRLKEAEAATS